MTEPPPVLHRQRSRPALLLFCMIVSSISIYTVLLLLWTTASWLPLSFQNEFTMVWMYGSRFVDFPWSMSVAVWMAARHGKVGYRTFVVPIGILIAGEVAKTLHIGLHMYLTMPNYPYDWISSIFHDGIHSIGTLLAGFVCLSLIFRTTTLHLRPLQSMPEPFHLTTRSLLVLTLLAAFLSLGYVFLNQLNMQPIELNWNDDNFMRALWYVMIVCHLPINSITWFSIAWLQDSSNQKRAVGYYGLLVYLLLSAIYHFVVYHLYLQRLLSLNSQAPIQNSVELLVSFAVSVVQLGFVFVSVRLMHACGYRWATNSPAPRIS